MSSNPVIWYEGLFVKPQHFQQQARAAEAQVQQRLNCLNDTLYGFSELELNPEYLSFGKIAIIRARGVMPDGSVFDIPNDQPPPPALDIPDSSAVNQIVHLCLLLRSDGALEVQWPDSYANSRYSARRSEVYDTHSEDGDQVSMELAVPNLQMMQERNDRSAFTGIALGRILDKRPDGSLVMDDDFYPTSVSVHAVPALKRYLGEIAGLMRERARAIAERIGSASQSGVPMSPTSTCCRPSTASTRCSSTWLAANMCIRSNSTSPSVRPEANWSPLPTTVAYLWSIRPTSMTNCANRSSLCRTPCAGHWAPYCNRARSPCRSKPSNTGC